MRIALAALLLTAAPAQAALHCRATPETKQCGLDGCSDSSSYLDVGIHGGTLSFCEGEGCAEGKILMRRQQGPVTFVFAQMTMHNESKTRFPLSLMMDSAAGVLHLSSGEDQRLIKCVVD
jgi:hypothetical protein